MTEDDIITALKNIQGPWDRRVYPDYPPSFAIFPVASVYTLSEDDIAEGDDKGLQVFGDYFNIDIWTKDRVDLIKAKVREAIYNLNAGYVKQINYKKIPEGEITHLTWEFKII